MQGSPQHSPDLCSCRGETGTSLIKPVIQGPKGAKFSPGTASISYFLGRYATMVLNKGDKGGVEGMDSFVRDNYFPVVQKVEGGSERWVADYNFQVRVQIAVVQITPESPPWCQQREDASRCFQNLSPRSTRFALYSVLVGQRRVSTLTHNNHVMPSR